MPIFIDDIKFTDDYTGLPSGNGSDTGVDFLMGCVGDLIYASIDFHVSWSILDSIFTFDSVNKTITLTPCIDTSNFLLGSGGSFITNGFQKGDTIVITGSGANNGTYTIASITDKTITVNEAIASSGVLDHKNIYGITEINFFDFYYNLLSNNASAERTGGQVWVAIKDPQKRTINNTYLSLTDPKSVQKFSGTVNPYYSGTFTLEPNATSQAWWDYKVDGIDIKPQLTDYGLDANYNRNFKLVFPFLITPLFLAEQLQLLQNAYAQSKGTNLDGNFSVPSYFDGQSLGFICQIDGRFQSTSPTFDHSTFGQVNFKPGNTTWYDTFFPTGVYLGGNLITKRQYDFVSIVYTDNSSNVLSSADIDNVTNVEIKIKRTGTQPLDLTKFVVNFMWLPTDPGIYQGYTESNQANFREVFLHDRCKTQLAAASKNGDQFGTSIQAITNCTGIVVDANTFKIDFKLDFGSLTKTELGDNNAGRNYMIWVTPQSSNVDAIDNTNRSAIISDVNVAFRNTDDPTLLTIITDGTSDVHFYKSTDIELSNPLTDLKDWSGEYGLMKCQFSLSQDTILKDISVQIGVQINVPPTIAFPGGQVKNFTLESWSQNTETFFDGTINQIDITQSRGFQLPQGEIRNTISIQREPSLDGIYGSSYAYTMYYGFQLGYKFWQQIQNITEEFSKYPADYWSVFTQGFAGNNSSNPVLSSGNTSKIKMLITWNVEDINTGITTKFISLSNIASYDEGSQIGSNAFAIQTTDLAGNNLNGVIPNDREFYILAWFLGDNLQAPGGYSAIGELVMRYNNGNSIIYDRILSSESNTETVSSVWTSIPELIYSPDHSELMIQAKIDLRKTTISNASIYGKLLFKKN